MNLNNLDFFISTHTHIYITLNNVIYICVIIEIIFFCLCIIILYISYIKVVKIYQKLFDSLDFLIKISPIYTNLFHCIYFNYLTINDVWLNLSSTSKL